jgi:hypothetical protein
MGGLIPIGGSPMLDLAGLPRGAFAGALQYNLERAAANQG